MSPVVDHARQVRNGHAHDGREEEPRGGVVYPRWARGSGHRCRIPAAPGR
jgi:hypothetical protein